MFYKLFIVLSYIIGFSILFIAGNKKDDGCPVWMEYPPSEFFKFVIPFEFEGSSKVSTNNTLHTESFTKTRCLQFSYDLRVGQTSDRLSLWLGK